MLFCKCSVTLRTYHFNTPHLQFHGARDIFLTDTDIVGLKTSNHIQYIYSLLDNLCDDNTA